MMSLLPGISYSCDNPTLPLHTSFIFPSICPLPLLSHLTFSLPVAICLSLSLLPLACPRGHLSSLDSDAAQPVCVSSLEVHAAKLGCTGSGVSPPRAPSACARTCPCTFSVMVTEDSAKSINEQHTVMRSSCSSPRTAALTPGCRCSRSSTPSSCLPPLRSNRNR